MKTKGPNIETRAAKRLRLQQDMGKLVEEHIRIHIEPFFPVEMDSSADSESESEGCLQNWKNETGLNDCVITATIWGQFVFSLRKTDFKCRACKSIILQVCDYNEELSEAEKKSKILWDKGFQRKVCQRCLNPVVKLERLSS